MKPAEIQFLTQEGGWNICPRKYRIFCLLERKHSAVLYFCFQEKCIFTLFENDDTPVYLFITWLTEIKHQNESREGITLKLNENITKDNDAYNV